MENLKKDINDGYFENMLGMNMKNKKININHS